MSLPTFKEKVQETSAAEDSSVPNFLKKTYDILENNVYSDIICWNSQGNAILIKDPSELAEKVLPIFFKHKNFTSYVRQLNLYGFKKQKSTSSQHVYYHEMFQRGKRHLLAHIKRKNNETNTTIMYSRKGLPVTKQESDEYNEDQGNYEEQKDEKSSDDEESQRESEQLVKENTLLNQMQKDMNHRINNLENQFKKFADQNRMLVNIIQNRENELEGLINSVVTRPKVPQMPNLQSGKDKADEGDGWKTNQPAPLQQQKNMQNVASNPFSSFPIAIPRVQNPSNLNLLNSMFFRSEKPPEINETAEGGADQKNQRGTVGLNSENNQNIANDGGAFTGAGGAQFPNNMCVLGYLPIGGLPSTATSNKNINVSNNASKNDSIQSDSKSKTD